MFDTGNIAINHSNEVVVSGGNVQSGGSGFLTAATPPLILIGAGSTLGYADTSIANGSTIITGDDGTHTANLALLGNYMAATLVITAGYGGSALTSEEQTTSTILSHPHG